MWIVGVSLLLLSTSIAVSYWACNERSPRLPLLWDIPAMVESYTEISGVLAALSLASAVFIATLAPDSPGFEASIGLFMFSFLILVAAAMQFGATPNVTRSATDSLITGQDLSYIGANCSLYLGTALSWLGLRLLLIAIGVPNLADILTWVLLFAIVAGALRIGMHLYRHGGFRGVACLSLPVVALGSALLYRFGADEVWSELWPDIDASLRLGIFAFVVGGVGYLFQTAVLALYGNPRWEPLVLRLGQKGLAAYAQSAVTVISLIWLAVAEA